MVVSRRSLDKTIALLPLSSSVDLGSLIPNSYFWTGVTSFEIKMLLFLSNCNVFLCYKTYKSLGTIASYTLLASF